ncbi:MAG: flagellin [Alteromonadaceae bacterium]|nr:flagellin [Alteromonadaceae bacterium]
MPQIINTNIMSLNSQRQLNKSQLMQNEAMERLSSGLRVNSAKDDAAGLAIATGMESQIRGINQAIRNANDGISMSQTAEGAMDEMTNILQRVRELAIQSANDTNSASNRASIQAEVDQLYSELDRIATVTQFNGVNVLDGSVGSTTLQIGANAGENLTFSIASVTTRDLNLNAVSGLGELNGGRVNDANAINTDDVTINGIGIGAVATGNDRALAMETAVNAISGITGVSASAYNVLEGVGNQTGVTSTLQINGVTLGPTGSMSELIDVINRDVPGVIASVSNSGALSLSNDTGVDIVIGAGGSEVGMVDDRYRGYLALTSSDQSKIELGTGTAGTANATQVQQFGFNLANGSDSVTGGEVTGAAITGADAIQINGVDLGAVTGTSAADKAFAINTITAQTGVTASATTEVNYQVQFPNISVSAMTLNGTTIPMAGLVSLDAVVNAINTSGIQGVVATADNLTGSLILTSQSGGDVQLSANAGSLLDSGGGAVSFPDLTRGTITLTGTDGKDILVTSNAASELLKDTALGKLGLTDFGGNASAIGTGLSVLTVANSENTIDRIDAALEKISNARAGLGAVQNRLASTISNLENVSQNLSSSKSRIVDADFAAETSKLSKAQILQQAGTAMLSQANASTQNVLSLLQG